ncbi:MAG: hypothetical protein ACI8RD_001328 [Bacillariaceae sp.]|jgi:hypothetical protein
MILPLLSLFTYLVFPLLYFFSRDPNLSRLNGSKNCGRQTDCFQLRVPENYTMLQAYNCDRQKPGEKSEKMPAEKQIYRPDYVLHHFIHYSTVTVMSELNRQDIEKLGRKWDSRSPFPDPLSRFGHEAKEALMLHTKAVATQDTVSVILSECLVIAFSIVLCSNKFW